MNPFRGFYLGEASLGICLEDAYKSGSRSSSALSEPCVRFGEQNDLLPYMKRVVLGSWEVGDLTAMKGVGRLEI